MHDRKNIKKKIRDYRNLMNTSTDPRIKIYYEWALKSEEKSLKQRDENQKKNEKQFKKKWGHK